MTEQRDLERRVEDFLEATAVTMPPALLDEVMADITMSGAGVHARFGGTSRWRLGAWLAAVGVFAAMVLVANIGRVDAPGATGSQPTGTPDMSSVEASARSSASASPPVAALGRHWDPWAYFRIGVAHLNPAPDAYGNAAVWSYEHGPAGNPGASIGLLTDFENDRWVSRGGADAAAWRDATGIGLHPGAHSAILVWTSPMSGDIRITGYFRALQVPCEVPSDGVTVSVVRDGTTLWTTVLTVGNQVFDLRSGVATGTRVSFVVDARSNSNCDGTEVALEITP